MKKLSSRMDEEGNPEGVTTVPNALSNPSFVSSAPIPRAVSMNRSLWGFS